MEGELEGTMKITAHIFNAGYDRETVKKLTGRNEEQLTQLYES